VAKGGVNDAMFCEACGLHRDQLGVAGDAIQTCPDCGRATCANCWNQVAVGCLACRPFALPTAGGVPARGRAKAGAAGLAAANVTTGEPDPTARTRSGATAPPTAAAATSAAATVTKGSDRRFKRGSKPQPDPVVISMPGVVEAGVLPAAARTAVPSPAQAQPVVRGTFYQAGRFGRIRLGRVVRATAIGSALAISVAAVVFAGVIRLAPAGVTGSQADPPGTTVPGQFATDPATGEPGASAPTNPAVVPGTPSSPGEPGVTPGTTDPRFGPRPTAGVPGATPAPGATPTPKPTTGATPPPTPTATPGSTPVPTPDPTPVPTPDPTPVPTPDPTPVPTPDPTPDPTPVPTPDPTPDPVP
jgi:hypothetical protein